MEVSWKKYIDKTSTNGPRALLVKAVSFVESKSEALDLGAGALNDSVYLVEQGFARVTAIDADDAAKERASRIEHPAFVFLQKTFEEYVFCKNTFDIINGQFAFSFISPDYFTRVFDDIKGSVKTNGVITGQLFGDRDEWNIEGSGKNFVTREEFDELFRNFDILHFEEEESDKETALGTPKHWHTFHFIVRKR